MPSIVQTNVSQILAPTPPTLQRTGAVISQGGTNLSSGTSALLTEPDDLTPILAAPLALSSLAWSAGAVLATTGIAIPGAAPGDKFLTTIAGATPAGYNAKVWATVTGANTFTYPLASNPGVETVAGTYTPPGNGELLTMINSYYGQGSTQAVYVLELGPANGSTGPTALDAWITANPGVFYSYLVPKGWDTQANYLALIAKYENPTSKTYFFTTTTVATRGAYTALMKDVLAEIESPTTPITEFSAAATFQAALAYNPGSASRMTPFANKFLFGVTPYPLAGNNALLQTLYDQNFNVVGTGAEGGISTAALSGGATMDGNDFTYWYSADWTQINGKLVLANEVFNGANDSANPLWYDQNGINRLQDRVVKLFQAGVAFALLQGSVGRAQLDGVTFQQNFDDDLYVNQCIVNAVPFVIYTQQNPTHYKAGIYNGLQCVIIPKRGFKQIIFNLTVSSLIAP
jgi:hypothetical protein